MSSFIKELESRHRELKTNLAKMAYASIKDAIIYNKFKIGEALSENALAEMLSMSRTPVREALKILQKEDLVEILPGRGAFVKGISFKNLRDIYAVRRSLECLAVETGLPNITADEIAHIKKAWLDLSEDVKKSKEVDLKTINSHDAELHNLIVRKSNNAVLVTTIGILNVQIVRYQALAAWALGRTEQTINEHLEIIAMMEKRDREGLKNVLCTHIDNAAENIILRLSRIDL